MMLNKPIPVRSEPMGPPELPENPALMVMLASPDDLVHPESPSKTIPEAVSLVQPEKLVLSVLMECQDHPVPMVRMDSPARLAETESLEVMESLEMPERMDRTGLLESLELLEEMVRKERVAQEKLVQSDPKELRELPVRMEKMVRLATKGLKESQDRLETLDPMEIMERLVLVHTQILNL